MAQLERELAISQRELARQQALTRTAQRARGLMPAAGPATSPAGKARADRRGRSRAGGNPCRGACVPPGPSEAEIPLEPTHRRRYNQQREAPQYRARQRWEPTRRQRSRPARSRGPITEGDAMPAGRKPLAIEELVEHLPGSPVAQERLRVILANIAGQISVSEACTALGIQESWFFELKHRSLQALAGSAGGTEPAGRRPAATPTPEQEQIAELENRIRHLESIPGI